MGGFRCPHFSKAIPFLELCFKKIGTGGMDNELLHGSRIHGVPRGLTDGPFEAYPWCLFEVVACLWSNRPLQSFKAASWVGSC